MLRGRLAEVFAVSVLAAIVTLVIAGPVLRAPSERVFGMEIVGRHHDPFTVMAQFGRPITLGVYSQPVTDITGALLARLSGAVAAYNWLVLLTFPLAAAAAYLLARHLGLSAWGAAVAAMAFAFSPFHMAQAAYHPHIAQTQWVPLYLLALWYCLDIASPFAIGFLGMATIGVTLSNFYGGLIAAVLTPVAVGAYWFARARTSRDAVSRLFVTIGVLALLGVTGLAYLWWTAPSVLASASAFANPPGDAFRYSAKWWSYLVPPVAHPLVGDLVRRMWMVSGVREGLLEQQVGLGLGVVALGLISTYCWLAGDRAAATASVPVLGAVAVAALLCSLSPERTIGGFTFVRPSALLRDLLPMFRAYARFGVFVQLMAALMAGVGVDCLRRIATRSAQIVCVGLVALAAGEYVVLPSDMWRDVLPTTAHRWVMKTARNARVLALDCTPLNQESESVQWLTNYRVRLQDGPIDDCSEPNLSGKLAASGYTHLLVRRDSIDGPSFADRTAQEGFRVAARFADGQVFAVTETIPGIYMGTMKGFFRREHDAEWTWRWMGHDASWTIVNPGTQPIVATLGLELSAFHHARRMELGLDGRHVQTLLVESPRRIYQIGPLSVTHGGHELLFHASEAPSRAGDIIDNGDSRPLSFAIGTWNWTVRAEQP